jgi:hypothetical protein
MNDISEIRQSNTLAPLYRVIYSSEVREIALKKNDNIFPAKTPFILATTSDTFLVFLTVAADQNNQM